MFPCRLQALPEMPLQEVARKVGLPARLLCKQLLEAYGPLQCGLRLQYCTPAQLLHILQHQCSRLREITSLALDDMIIESLSNSEDDAALRKQQQQDIHGVFAAVSTVFPRLQHLTAQSRTFEGAAFSNAQLELLAPLRSCLTVLKIIVDVASLARNPAPPSWQHLTSLRHLHVTMSPEHTRRASSLTKKQAQRWLDSFACLPALV